LQFLAQTYTFAEGLAQCRRLQKDLFTVHREMNLDEIFEHAGVSEFWVDLMVNSDFTILSEATQFAPVHRTRYQTILAETDAVTIANKIVLTRTTDGSYRYTRTDPTSKKHVICLQNLSFPFSGAGQSLLEKTRTSTLDIISQTETQLLDAETEYGAVSRFLGLSAPEPEPEQVTVINLQATLAAEILAAGRSLQDSIAGLENLSQAEEIFFAIEKVRFQSNRIIRLLNKIGEPLFHPERLLTTTLVPTTALANLGNDYEIKGWMTDSALWIRFRREEIPGPDPPALPPVARAPVVEEGAQNSVPVETSTGANQGNGGTTTSPPEEQSAAVEGGAEPGRESTPDGSDPETDRPEDGWEWFKDWLFDPLGDKNREQDPPNNISETQQKPEPEKPEDPESGTGSNWGKWALLKAWFLRSAFFEVSLYDLILTVLLLVLFVGYLVDVILRSGCRNYRGNNCNCSGTSHKSSHEQVDLMERGGNFAVRRMSLVQDTDPEPVANEPWESVARKISYPVVRRVSIKESRPVPYQDYTERVVFLETPKMPIRARRVGGDVPLYESESLLSLN